MKHYRIIPFLLVLLLSCKRETYHAITTHVQPADGGDIVMTPFSSTALEGSSVTFTAQPKGDYIFTGWSGSVSGTENPKTITVSSDINVTATFTLRQYPLTLSTEGEGTVSERVISTKTDYASGAVVELTAKAADHWVFDHWEGDLSGGNNPVQVAISSAKTLKAVFVKKMYDLTIEVQGEGAVKEAVVQTKASSYQEGTVVELTAHPADHWIFDHWEGDLSGSENPTQITIAAAKAIKAVFVEKMYDLVVEVEGEGAVEEQVVQTKGVYQEGTTVELSAIPANGWSFNHWEGDLQGEMNPRQIIVSSAKNVKAVFTKNKYTYILKIVGPGVVNEEMVETKGMEYGTCISLEAVANEFEGAVFAGWEGDASGSDKRITVRMDSDKTIVARFLPREETRNTRTYPLPDLSRPSYELKQIYVDEDFSQFTFSAYQMLQLDYNRDGYLDVITALYDGIGGMNDSDRIPIGFYLGNPDGTFTRDAKNDGRIQGMLHIRKMVYGDLNKDGFPDIVLIAHGYDAAPFPGEYPVILMSSPGGEYSDIRLNNLQLGFYHGGATGDIDNDGDLDIFLIDNYGHSGFLINDGAGNLAYTQELINLNAFVSLFNAELYDIDKDGYLDLICGGHDWEDYSYWNNGDTSYSNTPIVFWGNGNTYKDIKTTRLPETMIEGYGGTCDFLFYDLDKDGIEELILARTGDGERGGVKSNAGWAIQILKREERSFVDVTTNYLSLTDARLVSNQLGGEWLVKINIEDSAYDGKTYLCGSYDTPLRPSPEKLYEYTNKQLIPLYAEETEEKVYDIKGCCIYSDSFWGFDLYSTLSGINISYDQDAYQGEKCIHWKAGEAWQQSLSFQTSVLDFSRCIDEYEIEFYVKYTSPNLVLCTNIETKYDSPKEGFEHKAYGHSYPLPKEYADGEWHRIHAPLSEFYYCDNCDDTGWEAIQIFHMWVTSENTVGAEFYLDEIRIRKALPE